MERVQRASYRGHGERYFRVMRIEARLKEFRERMGDKEIEAVVTYQLSKMLTSERRYRNRLQARGASRIK